MRSTRLRTALALGAGLAIVATTTLPVFASHGTTTRISVTSNSTEVAGDSFLPAISANGRYTAFSSLAPDLVPGDTNGLADVFVHDRETGETTRVSVSSSGVESNGHSGWPSITADGRYVAFLSEGGTLIDEEPPLPPWSAFPTVYVHDRVEDRTFRGALQHDGEPAYYVYTPSISPDGRYIAYKSNSDLITEDKTDRTYDVFVMDLHTKTTIRIPCGDRYLHPHPALTPRMSHGGRFVAFDCDQPLTPDDNNNDSDVYLFDRQLDELIPVSAGTEPEELGGRHSGHPSISHSGRYVAFASSKTKLVENDTNDSADVFLYDHQTGTIERVSLTSTGGQADTSSVDRRLGYHPGSSSPSISPDGGHVAFMSQAALVDDDTNRLTDIYLRDLATGHVRRVSVSNANQDPDARSWFPTTANGGVTSYYSGATNLVPDDTNDRLDVFLYDPAPGPPTCPDGTYEEGPLSGPVHENIEPHTGPARPLAHDVNCELVVGSGL